MVGHIFVYFTFDSYRRIGAIQVLRNADGVGVSHFPGNSVTNV